MRMKELSNGWTFDARDIYHFEHVSKAWADAALEEQDERMFIVEVVHGTYADAEHKMVHLNRFVCLGFTSALVKAAAIQMQPYPDEVLDIRPATEDEQRMWYALYDHFNMAEDAPAISDEEAARLLEQD